MYQIADVIDEISKTKLYNDIIKNQINIKNKNNNLNIKTNKYFQWKNNHHITYYILITLILII